MSQQNATPETHQAAPVKSATSARQGIMTGHVRWILGISVTLAVVAMAVAYWVS